MIFRSAHDELTGRVVRLEIDAGDFIGEWFLTRVWESISQAADGDGPLVLAVSHKAGDLEFEGYPEFKFRAWTNDEDAEIGGPDEDEGE